VVAVWLMAMSIASDALAAQAKKVRFVDNLDGTITDNQTGLMWEKKLAADDVGGNCANVTQANRGIRYVNNVYQWSTTDFTPDGLLYIDFLANLNRADGSSSDGLTIDRQNYSDWRIPTIVELQTNLDLTVSSCGSTAPCINTIFGPTQASAYWSSTTGANNSFNAWVVNFSDGFVLHDGKDFNSFARAVRGGR
jgi:hypothetical protein